MAFLIAELGRADRRDARVRDVGVMASRLAALRPRVRSQTKKYPFESVDASGKARASCSCVWSACGEMDWRLCLVANTFRFNVPNPVHTPRISRMAQRQSYVRKVVVSRQHRAPHPSLSDKYFLIRIGRTGNSSVLRHRYHECSNGYSHVSSKFASTASMLHRAPFCCGI